LSYALIGTLSNASQPQLNSAPESSSSAEHSDLALGTRVLNCYSAYPYAYNQQNYVRHDWPVYSDNPVNGKYAL